MGKGSKKKKKPATTAKKVAKQRKSKSSKKRFKKEETNDSTEGDEQDSSDDDDDDDDDAKKPEKKSSQMSTLPPPPEKLVMLGALVKAPDPPTWFKTKLIQEERSDILASSSQSNLEQQDLDLLDNFMRSKEEFNPGDLVIVDDNMDEDSRDYVRYEILTKYNEGRYSSVYIAAKQTCKSDEETLDKTLYALKAGIRKESKNTKLRFKRELAVLRELNGAAAAHSPRLFDSGLVCGRTFIVMTLLDRNLEKLKENLKGTFRPTSVYYLASEALSALEALHSINYVHRDVKPTNFSIGVGPAASRLFLIDYGDTVKSGKTIKYSIPDAYSLPYMAIDMHKRTAATPKADIEAWFYTFAELLYPQILSWKRCHEETELAEVKAKFWSDVPESVSICSPQIIDLAKAINSISDKVDYAALRRLLDDAQNSSLKGAPLTLEWTKMPTKPEAKQGSAPVAPGSVIDPEKSVRSMASSKKKQRTDAIGHMDELRKSLAASLLQRIKFRPKKKAAKEKATAQKETAVEVSSQNAVASPETASAEGKPAEPSKTEPLQKPETPDKEESVFQSLRKRKLKIGLPKFPLMMAASQMASPQPTQTADGATATSQPKKEGSAESTKTSDTSVAPPTSDSTQAASKTEPTTTGATPAAAGSGEKGPAATETRKHGSVPSLFQRFQSPFMWKTAPASTAVQQGSVEPAKAADAPGAQPSTSDSTQVAPKEEAATTPTAGGSGEKKPESTEIRRHGSVPSLFQRFQSPFMWKTAPAVQQGSVEPAKATDAPGAQPTSTSDLTQAAPKDEAATTGAGPPAGGSGEKGPAATETRKHGSVPSLFQRFQSPFMRKTAPAVQQGSAEPTKTSDTSVAQPTSTSDSTQAASKTEPTTTGATSVASGSDEKGPAATETRKHGSAPSLFQRFQSPFWRKSASTADHQQPPLPSQSGGESATTTSTPAAAESANAATDTAQTQTAQSGAQTVTPGEQQKTDESLFQKISLRVRKMRTSRPSASEDKAKPSEPAAASTGPPEASTPPPPTTQGNEPGQGAEPAEATKSFAPSLFQNLGVRMRKTMAKDSKPTAAPDKPSEPATGTDTAAKPTIQQPAAEKGAEASSSLAALEHMRYTAKKKAEQPTVAPTDPTTPTPVPKPLAPYTATEVSSGQTTPMGGEKTSAMGLFTRFLAQRRKEAEAGATAQPQTETTPQKGGTGEEKGSGEKKEKGDAGQSPEKPNAEGTEKKSDKASGEGSQSTGSKSKSAEKTTAENKVEGGSGSAKKKSTSGSAEKKGSAEKATSTESKDKRGSAELVKSAYKKPVEAAPDAKKPAETADKKEEAKTGTAPDQTPKENKLMKFWKRFKKKE
ncbi:hypothetical protein Q1695_013360 [Nippostrongylus brasiliensis]|nr:hypothetical protein Q1695_013360 [Nippostrongylus brasiliensis]